MTSYEKNGFGLSVVVLKESGVPIGMCGLLKRDYWDEIDIGYALLERYWSNGYAYEAASAMMDYAHNVLKLPRIVAITAPDNDVSGRVLQKIGLRFDKLVTLGHDGQESKFFVPAEG
jgi:RimJ/RimL family protein N-acetyltransferase